MELGWLLYTLLDFVKDPTKSWGQPNFGSLTEGFSHRVNVEQADRNSARLLSGTYTQGQYENFQRQAVEVERKGSGTARFPGDPYNLPSDVPERTCLTCGKSFRSICTEKEVSCYDCAVDHYCPKLPGKLISAGWTPARKNSGWCLDVSGDIGFRNEMAYCWYNRNSSGNMCHQMILVHRSAEGEIQELVFMTLAQTARRCYKLKFDIHTNTVKFTVCKATSLYELHRAPESKAEDLGLVVDLVVAMLPEWMLYAHKPKRSDTSPYPYVPKITVT